MLSLFKKYLLLVIFTGISCTFFSCHETSTSSANIPKYNTFQLRADDVRLQCFTHPLYRLEYPVVFGLADENLADIPTYSCFETEVFFTVQIFGLPKPKLTITVEKPNKYYQNSQEKIDYIIAQYSGVDKIITDKKEVSGIAAQFLLLYAHQEEATPYPAFISSSRVCVFEYSNLIWNLKLDWYYQGNEPPEAQVDFEHVIASFKILD
jgi:hypothetical protein